MFRPEVGELPLGLQVKLLRVLQDRCFYRLGGTVPITVSTRIIAATNRDLEKMKHNKPISSLAPEVIVAFLNYNWPGNVRELHNVTERLAVLSDEGTLESKYLPPALQRTISEPVHHFVSLTSRILDRSIQRNSSVELERICNAIEKTHGNKSAAAELLGISRGTLYYKLKQYALG